MPVTGNCGGHGCAGGDIRWLADILPCYVCTVVGIGDGHVIGTHGQAGDGLQVLPVAPVISVIRGAVDTCNGCFTVAAAMAGGIMYVAVACKLDRLCDGPASGNNAIVCIIHGNRVGSCLTVGNAWKTIVSRCHDGFAGPEVGVPGHASRNSDAN